MGLKEERAEIWAEEVGGYFLTEPWAELVFKMP